MKDDKGPDGEEFGVRERRQRGTDGRDSRDKVEKLQEAIANTQENIRDAETMLQARSGEMSERDREDIEAKNGRRREAVHEFRKEIKGEFID